MTCGKTSWPVASSSFAVWVSYENGKNRYEAIADIDEAIDFLRYYSEEMKRNNGFETIMKKRSSKRKEQERHETVWSMGSNCSVQFSCCHFCRHEHGAQ